MDIIQIETENGKAADLAYEQAKKSVAIQELRQKIEQKAGDPQSILGTTNDTTQLLLYGFTLLVSKLQTASSLGEIKEALVPFAEFSTSFQERLRTGEAKLTFMEKGFNPVLNDMERRSKIIADELQAASPNDNNTAKLDTSDLLSAASTYVTTKKTEVKKETKKRGITRFTSGALASINRRTLKKGEKPTE